MVVRTLVSLVLLALAHVALEDVTWTRDDAASHADRFNDRSIWRRDWLRGDAARHRRTRDANEWMPFSTLVFSAPPYADTERPVPGLGVTELALPEPMLGTLAFVNEATDEEDVAYEDTPIRPVLVVVVRGSSPLEHVDQQALARSHPHYFFQSAFLNEDGEIDCVALQLADGRRIAIINGRILDLEVGNLVLVRQFEDGSVHIHQHRDGIDAAPRIEIAGEIGRRLSAPRVQAFWR